MLTGVEFIGYAGLTILLRIGVEALDILISGLLTELIFAN